MKPLIIILAHFGCFDPNGQPACILAADSFSIEDAAHCVTARNELNAAGGEVYWCEVVNDDD